MGQAFEELGGVHGYLGHERDICTGQSSRKWNKTDELCYGWQFAALLLVLRGVWRGGIRSGHGMHCIPQYLGTYCGSPDNTI